MSKDVFVSKSSLRILSIAGAAALIAGITLTLRPHSAPAAPVARPAAPISDSVPYTPSRFPGVQVRQIPEVSATSGTVNAAAWLGKRHGVVSPRSGMRQGLTRRNSTAVLRTGRGTTPAGGKWVEMPSERVPLAVARRQNGKPAVDCIMPSAKMSKLPAKTTR